MTQFVCKTRIIKYAAFLLFFIFSVIALPGQSQWKVLQNEAKKENILSLLPSGKHLRDGYTFFGTSFDYSEHVITKGYEPFLQNTVWTVPFNKRISFNNRSLYINIYTVNVSMLQVHVFENDSTCYEQRFYFPKDGYQLPFEWTLTEPCKRNNALCKKMYDYQPGSSSLFTAKITLKDSSLPYKMVAGETKIYEKSYVKTPGQGHFFYELTKKKENQLPEYIRRKFGNAYPLQQEADFISFKGSPYIFELEQKDIGSTARQKATLQLIRYIFQKYLYYKEHALSEQEIVASVDKIIADTLSFSNKITLLRNKAKTLHDAHFYFNTEKGEKRNVTAPLILKRIHGAIQIVGFRDVRLEQKISLGDKLYSIDAITCDSVVDSLSNDYFGDLRERQELAISHLLEQPVNTSPCIITIQNAAGALYQVTLDYDKKFPAPEKFRPEHFGFSRLGHNWVYLKINKWDRGDWIRFYNLKDSINKATGIVFDLRGNPGGFGIEGISIASCFLKKPFVYSTQTYTMYDTVYAGQTIMKPNRFLDLSGIKVIMLVDNKTACASESFALVLKKITGATIIGASKTGGSFSTVYSLQLPEHTNLFANVLSKTYLLNEGKIIEYAGIVPDLFVEINKYTDLYGYDDSVLKTALEMIDRSSTYIHY